MRRWDEFYTTTADDEQPVDIAARLSVDVWRLVAANRGHLRGLEPDSLLWPATVLLVPRAGSHASADDSGAGSGEPAAARKKREQQRGQGRQ